MKSPDSGRLVAEILKGLIEAARNKEIGAILKPPPVAEETPEELTEEELAELMAQADGMEEEMPSEEEEVPEELEA